MKKITSIIVFCLATVVLNAQSVGGLWQGSWTSPDGFRFDFVLHIDEFPDGSMEGYIYWKFVQAPEGNWYYSGRENQEATEFVKGKVAEEGKLLFEGYKKDDPYSIIALDVYHLAFDESFQAFSGTTGHHGTWNGRIEGMRIGLP